MDQNPLVTLTHLVTAACTISKAGLPSFELRYSQAANLYRIDHLREGLVDSSHQLFQSVAQATK